MCSEEQYVALFGAIGLKLLCENFEVTTQIVEVQLEWALHSIMKLFM